jgi:hypothetical protein
VSSLEGDNIVVFNYLSASETWPATRLEELRKYAAIYGRFDSKRKNVKPMSMHEV